MSNPPPIPEGPEMGDEAGDLWRAHRDLLGRLADLEEIAERLAATSADPIAVSDFWLWKAQK